MANNKIHPDIEQMIAPIIYNMTKIYLTQEQQKKLYNRVTETEETKIQKRSCVHIMFEDGGYVLAANRNEDGKIVCKCCGREIGSKFDDDAVKKISDAIPVINQLLMFGMGRGLRKTPVEHLIILKNLLPEAAQLMKELNEFVKNDEARISKVDRVGWEYQSDPLTRM